MYLPITSAFAAIFGLIIVWLILKVTKLRRKYKTAIGEIDNDEYQRKNGALANLVTTLPLVLILMALAETAHFCWLTLGCIGLVYLVARLTHIYSLYHYETKTKRFQLRIISMATTFLVIILLSAINLYLSYIAISQRIAGGAVNIAFRVIHLYISALS